MGFVISKCKPGGSLGHALSSGLLGQTGSLGCRRGRSLRLLGWCRSRLCPLSLLLVRSHALLQPEHLAHSACGEGERATPVGGERSSKTEIQAEMRTQVQKEERRVQEKLRSSAGKWANRCRWHWSNTEKCRTGRPQPPPHPRVPSPCWPSRPAHLSRVVPACGWLTGACSSAWSPPGSWIPRTR